MPVKRNVQGRLRIELFCDECGLDTDQFGAILEMVARNYSSTAPDGERAVDRMGDYFVAVGELMAEHAMACSGHDPELVVGVA